MSRILKRMLPPLLLASTLAAHAIEIEALTPRFGLVLVANGVPTTDSAAGPIAGTLGIDASMPFEPGSMFALEPGFEVFSFHSELLETQPLSGPLLDLPRAVPAPAESAASSWTAGLLVSAPFVARPRLAESLRLVFGAGPAFAFKVAMGGQTPLELNAWYFSKARWLHAEARMGIELVLAPGMSLAADVRAFYPLSNLWTDPDPDLWLDGAALQLGLGMRLALDRRPAAADAADDEAAVSTESSPVNPPP